MMDSYRSTPPEYYPYVLRSRLIRAEAFRTALRFISRAIGTWFIRGYKKMKCWHIQRRAEQELRGLNNIVLKDMGITRSEITFRVRDAMPCS